MPFGGVSDRDEESCEEDSNYSKASLQCLSAVSQIETQPSPANGLRVRGWSPVPFGGVSDRDIRPYFLGAKIEVSSPVPFGGVSDRDGRDAGKLAPGETRLQCLSAVSQIETSWHSLHYQWPYVCVSSAFRRCLRSRHPWGIVGTGAVQLRVSSAFRRCLRSRQCLFFACRGNAHHVSSAFRRCLRSRLRQCNPLCCSSSRVGWVATLNL